MARNYKSIAEPKTLSANLPSDPTELLYNTVTLNNTTGLPTPPFILVIDADTAEEEAILCNSTAGGSSYNVTRAVESGASPKNHTITTSTARHMIVGSDLQLVHNHIDLTATHGAEGAVVGTTNTQTLENKRLTTPKINENVTLTATSTELNVLDGITASTAELNYTDGVTSAIQTQIDTKAPSAGPTFTGTVVLPSTTSIGTVSATELGYVDGVTSAIQTQLNALTAAVTAAVPTGVISPYAGLDSNIPTGYLLCNGQAVSRTTYATLFGVVSTVYGVGDNSTTFNLPDLRGRAPIGAGTGTGLTARALGATVGTETHILTPEQMPSHNHTSLQYGPNSGGAGLLQTGLVTTDSVTGNAGSGQAHPNMQPSLALNFIIKS
jgi:microcystin-dependent protein